MIDLWLLIAKFAFLALLYLFVFWALAVIRRDNIGDFEIAPPAPDAKIRVMNGQSIQRSYDIIDSVLIGRAPESDVRLDDVSVSARHAKVGKHGRHWTVEDLDSSNGTFVNGRRIAGSCRLNPGDRIAIGRTELTVEVLSK